LTSVLGWGATEFGGEKSKVLQQVKLPVVSYADCIRNAELYSKVDKFSMLCAGYGDNKTIISGCDGDAGGSFVCKDGSKWVLQGVISWGDAKCGGYYYSIMTRISSFIEWIDCKMAEPALEKRTLYTYIFYILKRYIK
jgi:chymotrypsin-like protease